MSIQRPDILANCKMVMHQDDVFRLVQEVRIYADSSAEIIRYFLEVPALNKGFVFTKFLDMMFEYMAGRNAAQENDVEGWARVLTVKSKAMREMASVQARR